MKRILFFFLILCLVSYQKIAAQATCAFDKIHEERLRTDPAYQQRIEQDNQKIFELIQAHPEWRSRTGNRVEALYIIPVVVHVMHTGGAIGTTYNPSDAQITGAINYLNQVYAGTYPGMNIPFGGSSIVNMEIQFALAQRTPSCGATNGIDRVDASGLSGYVANGVNSSSSASDIALKNLARWNPANYYNIYVVNKIDGNDGTSGQFIAGYAQFAGGPSNTDGTVMLATQMVTGQKTLPHEVGHALNLYHTFQGSNDDTQCPSTTSCASTGDLICDTDPISRNYNTGTGLFNFACRTGTNSCTGSAYTINTERNFMAYTSCYTLFTADQKLRVQAAMALPSRASLVDPSNLALVPCGTNINFIVASSSVAENIAGTLSGCRRYTDYTYQMNIGTGPSATATATLSLSGTATQGLDYDITTNGSFVSPGSTLTFNAGATVSQSFTVRIYDDRTVESPETIIVDFSVNNGGGNAAKGTTIPTMTIGLTDNDYTPIGASSNTYTIGAAPFFAAGNAPFNATLSGQRSQFIYSAAELNSLGITAGILTALQLNVYTKGSTLPFSNLTIKMGHTSQSNVVDGSFYEVAGLTTVYTNASYTTALGWNVFTLSTPFTWDGTSNIAVEFCFNNGSTNGTAGNDQIYYYQDGSIASQKKLAFQDNITCAGSFSLLTTFVTDIKPLIRFTANISATPVETVAASTSSLHLINGSNDYFFSNNNKLLARLSAINAPLGCVNMSLPNAGTTWASYQGGQRSAKVFAVTPTTNGGTAGYTISLYFDNSELGGKTASTLKIAKTTAATIAASNSSNTIMVTPTVTTLGSSITVFTASFTGFSLFFLADAAVTLPVNLIDFTGHLNLEQNSVLLWKTASEENNREYELEISRDGNNFALLGTVPSKGNSSGLQEYQYIQVKPQAGVNWYRLKQKDWDGKFAYSKVISLNIQKSVIKTFVYPIPAKDVLTINFGEIISNARIEILSADMKSVKTEMITGMTIRKEISISSLSPGVYFMKIMAGNNEEVVQFLKD